MSMRRAKRSFNKAYEMANTKYFIEKKLKEYEEVNLNQRHHLVINDVSGRKKS